MGDKDDAAKAALDKDIEDPPPPYSESPSQPASSGPSTSLPQLGQTQTPPSPQRHPPPPRQFPPAWNLYQLGAFSTDLILGEHANAPLYAITQHTGWSGQPDLVLHNGPSTRSAPLATGEAHSGFSSTHSTITLPPLPGAGPNGTQERLYALSHVFQRSWGFEVEVGLHPAVYRRETFQWRPSSGDAVASLDGVGGGYKLVRMATDAPPGVDGDGGRFAVGGATSSDGGEIVAVWADANSLSKRIKFRFLGSGDTGVLGERWAVMAVMTALRINQDFERD